MRTKTRILAVFLLTALMLLAMTPTAWAESPSWGECKESVTGYHAWVWVPNGGKEPTCTEDGYIKFVCMSCGATTTQPVSALGHDWRGWKDFKGATCTEPSLQTRTCRR